MSSEPPLKRKMASHSCAGGDSRGRRGGGGAAAFRRCIGTGLRIRRPPGHGVSAHLRFSGFRRGQGPGILSIRNCLQFVGMCLWELAFWGDAFCLPGAWASPGAPGPRDPRPPLPALLGWVGSGQGSPGARGPQGPLKDPPWTEIGTPRGSQGLPNESRTASKPPGAPKHHQRLSLSTKYNKKEYFLIF